MKTEKRYQICSRCIMDTSDPEITFDKNGVCCYCDSYDHRLETEIFQDEDKKNRLTELVRKIKNKIIEKKYDCLLGVSGGVDSSYVLLKLIDLGLRPLAMHVDNGWNSELAVDNIKNMLEKFNVDLVTHVLNWENFRDIQLAFLKASVPNAEIPTDHAIVALNFHTARQHGIKYIINGGNITTEAFMPLSFAYDARDKRHLKALNKVYNKNGLGSFPAMGIPSALYHVLFRGVKWISILNYFDYQKSNAIEELSNRVGWREYGGKHYESIYTRFYQGYLLKEKFGFDAAYIPILNIPIIGYSIIAGVESKYIKKIYLYSDLEEKAYNTTKELYPDGKRLKILNANDEMPKLDFDDKILRIIPAESKLVMSISKTFYKYIVNDNPGLGKFTGDWKKANDL